MRAWERATTRCGWDALPAAPLARFVNLHGCGDIGDGIVACVETVSTPTTGKRFGRGPEAERMMIAVTANYLVWASGSGDQQAIAAARLGDITAKEYQSTVLEDTGLDVVGFRLGATERESWFLPPRPGCGWAKLPHAAAARDRERLTSIGSAG